jgi:hypothetical protein
MQSAEPLDGGLIHAGHRLYHSVLITDVDKVARLVHIGLQIEEGDGG